MEEILEQKNDSETRKLLTRHGLHHPKADVERLYIKRWNSGCRLTKFIFAYNSAIVGLSNYIKRTKYQFSRLVKTPL